MTQGAEHYVHIMLIGEHVDHVYTAIEDANGQITVLAGIAGTIWAASAVHAYLNGPGSEKKKKEKKKKKKVDPEPEVQEQALSKVNINLAYDPTIQQTQLKFSIPLNLSF